MDGRLEGKTALVTGAGSCGPGWGNGKAVAVQFAREGASVFCADINLDAARETTQIIEDKGGRCVSYECDVSSREAVEKMVEACVAELDGIDILHNNVGIIELGGAVDTSEESWDRVLDVNLKSMFLTCKYAIPHMIEKGGGAIVNIASSVGIRWHGVAYISYSTTKAAIIHFTKVVAMEFASRNIRCNCILPGFINTPLVRASVSGAYDVDFDEVVALRDAQIPLGKMGDAFDVAHAAVYLASDEAKFVTGAELVVDGGMTCQTIAPGNSD